MSKLNVRLNVNIEEVVVVDIMEDVVVMVVVVDSVVMVDSVDSQEHGVDTVDVVDMADVVHLVHFFVHLNSKCVGKFKLFLIL